jgi:BatD DUF11 like domain
MVGHFPRRRAAAWLVGLCGLLIAGNLMAEVTASIDRDRIEANESFTLKITIDSTRDVTPDLTVLEPDFELGQTSQLTEAHIVFGEVQRSVTWSVVLTPRRDGALEIPPITVGSEQSQPLTITVVKPAYEPPGEADVFVASEIDFDNTYVQAQVLYRIKIYRAVATRQPALREPQFSGAEVLVEQASDERNYEAVLNGRAYNVVEYVFALFPQESGEITISPARFEARVLRDGRISGRKVFASDSHVITVKPIPPPPPEHPNAAWLPARDLKLTENWSREPDQLKAGEPISRDVTVSALGQLETQIPAIAPPAVDGVNIYPDRPVLSRDLETGGIRGMRTDQYAMIGVQAGTVTLPAVELPWWDIDAGEWQLAALPAKTLNVLPSPAMSPPPAAAPAEPEPDTQPATGTASPPSPAPLAAPPFWRQVAAILALLWLLTLVAWWWSSRPRRAEREAPPVPLHKQQARYLKSARRAAVEENGAAVRQALLDWAALQWPGQPPRSVGELATRVAPPLAGELQRLSRASYGAGDAHWDGEALARALRSIVILGEERPVAGEDALPPLMPG